MGDSHEDAMEAAFFADCMKANRTAFAEAGSPLEQCVFGECGRAELWWLVPAELVPVVHYMKARLK